MTVEQENASPAKSAALQNASPAKSPARSDAATKPAAAAAGTSTANLMRLVKAIVSASRNKATGDKLFAKLQGPSREETFRELSVPACSIAELNEAYQKCNTLWNKFLERDVDFLMQVLQQECDSMMECDKRFRQWATKTGKKLQDRVTLSEENLRAARSRIQAYWSNITPGNVAMIVNNLAGKCPNWDSAEKKFEWVWKKGDWREDLKAVRIQGRELTIQDLEEAERRCRQRFGLSATVAQRTPGAPKAPVAPKVAAPAQVSAPAPDANVAAKDEGSARTSEPVEADAKEDADAKSKAKAESDPVKPTAPAAAKAAAPKADAPVVAAQPTAVLDNIAVGAVRAAFHSGASSVECQAIAEVAGELAELMRAANSEGAEADEPEAAATEAAATEAPDEDDEIARVRAEINMLKGASETSAPADASAVKPADATGEEAATVNSTANVAADTTESAGVSSADASTGKVSVAEESEAKPKKKETPMTNEDFIVSHILKKCSDMESARKFFKWLRQQQDKEDVKIRGRSFVKADIDGAERRCKEIWGVKDEDENKDGKAKAGTESSLGNVEVIVQQVLKKCTAMSQTDKYWDMLSRTVGEKNPMGRIFTLQDVQEAKSQVAEIFEAQDTSIIKDDDTLASLVAPSRKRMRDKDLAKQEAKNKGKTNADVIVQHVLLKCNNMNKAERIFEELNATVGQATALARTFSEEDITEAYFLCQDMFDKRGAQESSGSSDSSDDSSDSSSSEKGKRRGRKKKEVGKKKGKKNKRKKKGLMDDALEGALFGSDSEDSDLEGEEELDEEDENIGGALLADLGDDEEDTADLDDGYPVQTWEELSPELLPGYNGFNQRATEVMTLEKVAKAKLEVTFDKEAACPPLQPHQEAVAFLLHPRSPCMRLLVDHPTGSGKTREMIKVLDNFFFDKRPKIPIFPKDPVCRNFYAELLRWPSRYRDYFCCERPADAAIASGHPNWREHRFHMWNLSDFREDEVRRLCYSIREVLEMKGQFLRGMVRKSVRIAFRRKNPGEAMPKAPLRALGYTSAGGSFSSIIDDKPQSSIMKIGYEKLSNNVYNNKIVLMDEAHNLVRTQTQYAEQLHRLRDLLYTAKNLSLAGFTGTPILNEPTEGRQLLDIIKGMSAPEGDEGFLSSFPFRPQPLFPLSLPRGIPDGVLTVARKRNLVQRVEIHGESLRIYDYKRRLGIPGRRLRAYCNACTYHGSFHDGKNGTKVKVLTFPEDCCPKLLAIANAVASSKEKAVIMTSRQTGYIIMLELMRFIAAKQGDDNHFGVATMDELSEFNHVSNLRGEIYRVLVADAFQCSEGVSFFAVRRTFLTDVPVSPSQFIQQCGRAIRMYGHRGLTQEEQTVTNQMYVATFPKWMRSSLACWALRAQKKHVSGKDTEKKARLLTARLNRAGIKTLEELKNRIDALGLQKQASQMQQNPEDAERFPEKVQLTAEDVVGFLEQNGLWEEAKLLRIADKKEREKFEQTAETKSALMKAIEETQDGLAPGELAKLSTTLTTAPSGTNVDGSLLRSDTAEMLSGLTRSDTAESLGDASLLRSDTLQSLSSDALERQGTSQSLDVKIPGGLDDFASALSDVIDAGSAGMPEGGSALSRSVDEAVGAVDAAVNSPKFDTALSGSAATAASPGRWESQKTSATAPSDVKDEVMHDAAAASSTDRQPAEVGMDVDEPQASNGAVAATVQSQPAAAAMEIDSDQKDATSAAAAPTNGDVTGKAPNGAAKETPAALLFRTATFLKGICDEIAKAGQKTKQSRQKTALAQVKAQGLGPEADRGRTPSPEREEPDPNPEPGEATSKVDASANAEGKGPTPSPSPEGPGPSPSPEPGVDPKDETMKVEDGDGPKPSPEPVEFNDLSITDKAIAAKQADAEWRNALVEGLVELRKNELVIAALRTAAPGFEDEGDIRELTAEQVKLFRDEVVRLDKAATCTQALAAVQVAIQEIDKVPEGGIPNEAWRGKLESSLQEVLRDDQVKAAIKAAEITGSIAEATVAQVRSLRDELLKLKDKDDQPQAKPRALVRAVQALYTAVSFEDAVLSLQPETADEEAMRQLTERSQEFAPALKSMRSIAVDHKVFLHLADQSDDEGEMEKSESEESDVGKDLIGKRGEPAPLILPDGWRMEWVQKKKRQMREFVDPVGNRYSNVNAVRAAIDAWELRGGPPLPDEEGGGDEGLDQHMAAVAEDGPNFKRIRLSGKQKAAPGSGLELPPSFLDFEGLGESLEDAFGAMLDSTLGLEAVGSSQPAEEADSMELGPGKKVKLHSLMAKPELNGKIARVVKMIPETGRWECWLLEGAMNEKVNVKAANLDVVPEVKPTTPVKTKGRGRGTPTAPIKRALSATPAPGSAAPPAAKRGRGAGRGAPEIAPGRGRGGSNGAAAAKATPGRGGKGKGRGRGQGSQGAQAKDGGSESD